MNACTKFYMAIAFAFVLCISVNGIPGSASSFRSYDTHSPIVTNAAQAVESVVSPIAKKVAMVSAYDGNAAVYTNKNGEAKADYRVVIGSNAVSDGDDGTHGQSVVIGRDAQAHSRASCAIGPNTETDDDGFNIAIGWRSIAVMSGAIAIGCGTQSGQNYWLDAERTVHNPNERETAAVGTNSISIGRGTRAEHNSSIALGAGAKSHAIGAIQLGAGINDEQDTLKFQNTVVVKDGKVVGSFESSMLDPQLVELADSSIVTAIPHRVTSVNILDTAQSKYPEIEVHPSGTRNYQLFIDNNLGNRKNLPMWVTDGGNNIMISANGGILGPFFKLPVMFKSIEPLPKRVILDVQYIDDGYDWNPTMTNVQATVVTSSETGFDAHIASALGTELHFLTNWTLKLQYGMDVVHHKMHNVHALYDKVSFDFVFSTNAVPDKASIASESEGFSREAMFYSKE